MLILPELALAGCAIFLATSGALFRSRPQLLPRFALLAGCLLLLLAILALPARGGIFSGHGMTAFSQLCKLMLFFLLAMGLWAGRALPGIEPRKRPLYYSLLFVHVFALTIQVSANELGLLLSALVCATLSQALLIALRHGHREEKSQEVASLAAACKTLLFGLTATGLSLYGMSLLFGLCGSTELPGIAAALQGRPSLPHIALIALLLCCCGFFQQLALFPFHFWLPDACQGAAHESVPFLVTLPGIAAAASLVRLLSLLPLDTILPLGHILGGMGLFSLFFGSLAALGAQDCKRFLAYMAIAQAGLVVFALMPLQRECFALALLTTASGQLALLASCLPLCSLVLPDHNPELRDLRGLLHEQPLLACVLTAAFFSLAGLPPFAGFMVRLMVFTEALNRGNAVLVVLACLATTPAIAASLRALRFIHAQAENGRQALPATPLALLGIDLTLTAMLLLLGLFPAKMQMLCAAAIDGL